MDEERNPLIDKNNDDDDDDDDNDDDDDDDNDDEETAEATTFKNPKTLSRSQRSVNHEGNQVGVEQRVYSIR